MNWDEYLHDEARSLEHTYESADAVADAATRRSIGRRRAVRHGATASASLVAVGAVVLTGIRLSAVDQNGPAAPIGVDGAATVHPGQADELRVFDGSDMCGEPAPEGAASGDGFSYIARNVGAHVYDPLRFRYGGTAVGDIVSHRSVEVPVAATMTIVVVQDGKVVGWGDSPWAPTFGTVAPGEALRVSRTLNDIDTWCPLLGELPRSGPPVGEYDAYPVVTISGSPQAAGWRALADARSRINPAFPLNPASLEGGEECEAMEAVNADDAAQGLPLAERQGVAPECLGAYAVDIAGGTVTVPYPGEYYIEDVDVTLLGAPFTFIVTGTDDEADLRWLSRSASDPFPDDPQCDSEFNGSKSWLDEPLEIMVGMQNSSQDLVGGKREIRAFSPVYDGGTIDIRPELQVWLSRPTKETGVRVVIGHATVLVDGPMTVQAGELDDFATSTGTITSIEFCPREETQALSVWFQSTVIADGTVTSTDGNAVSRTFVSVQR